MRRLTKAMLTVGSFSLVTLGIVAAGAHSRKLIQIVEMDGNRQYEYKIFGDIPLEEQRPDPSLVVRPEVLTALNTLHSPPGLHLERATDTILTKRGSQVGYFGRVSFTGNVHDVLNYYQQQMTRTSRLDTKSVSSVRGVAPNGDQVVVTIYPRTMVKGHLLWKSL